MNIQDFKAEINSLSTSQRKELINIIKNSYSIFDEKSEVKECPYCNSIHIVKNGTRKGINRFICKECGKSFTYKTNTPIHYIHKINKWNDFVNDFTSLNFSTLEELTDSLKINKKTAFDWRHKLLSSLINEDVNFKNESVEFDEIYVKLSRKGCTSLNLDPKNKNAYRKWRKNMVGDSNYQVKLFFAFGRESKNLDITQSHMGRTSYSNMNNYFIDTKFDNVTVLSDSHRTYSSYFKSKGVNQLVFKAKDHINYEDKSIHNQTINAYAKHFGDFINKHLKGVSTKYLSFYAKWFQFICNTKNQLNKITSKIEVMENIICDKVIESSFGLEMYRQAEYSFISFLKSNKRSIFGHCKNHYYSKVA